VPRNKAAVEVDVEALARALVPLLIPPLVAALAESNARPTSGLRIPPPPPAPPRRLWTAKEAADWNAAPDHRIVWDELGNVVGLHEQIPGVRYWEVVGYNELRTKAWVQLMPYVKWEPEHSLFYLLELEGKQPDPHGDPERFRRWQEWCVRNPAREYGPIYPWSRRRRRQRQPT
jgi:hypothetical protein